MAFAAGSNAMEIDFESWPGREMMDFLTSQITDPETKTGEFDLEFEGRRYVCRFVLDRTHGAKQAEVK